MTRHTPPLHLESHTLSLLSHPHARKPYESTTHTRDKDKNTAQNNAHTRVLKAGSLIQTHTPLCEAEKAKSSHSTPAGAR